jgi:hypothetical protein
MRTLSGRFIESKGRPIQLDGETVHASHKVVLSPGIHPFQVRRVASKAEVKSGLQLKIRNGSMLVNGQSLAEFTLWTHTAPPVVEVQAEARSSTELLIWNVWLIEGLVQAWVGEAGIKIYCSGSSTRLECSGGGRVPDFTTLVVEVQGLPERQRSLQSLE